MAEQSIFISLLDRMKRGSTSRPLANEKTVINGNQVTPNSNPIQQKQQTQPKQPNQPIQQKQKQ